MKKSLVAPAGLVVGAKISKSLADYVHQNGKLEITNHVDYGDISLAIHNTLHWSGGKEGYGDFDQDYCGPPFWDKPTITKIISRVEEKELKTDTRPLNSKTPIDLELSLHEKDGNLIEVPNLKNELRCSFPVVGLDFGKKPITLWRRHETGKSEEYDLEFLADIREAIAKQGGEAKIPLPNLNETYESQDPYDYLQVRFDVFPGDFDLHSRVDLSDFAYMGKDWGKTGRPGEFITDISGPNGIPDGNVNFYDLEMYAIDYLKDPNDPNTW